MNSPIYFLRLAILALVISILGSTYVGSEAPGLIMRPKLIKSFTPCVELAEWGTYRVPKGTLIEIGISYPNSNDCPHKYSYETEGKHVVVKSLRAPLKQISGELSGEQDSRITVVHFFKANKRGHETITFSLGDSIYEYHIVVT